MFDVNNPVESIAALRAAGKLATATGELTEEDYESFDRNLVDVEKLLKVNKGLSKDIQSTSHHLGMGELKQAAIGLFLSLNQMGAEIVRLRERVRQMERDKR